MYLLVCRTSNRVPAEKDVIDSHFTLKEAKAALRRECIEKKAFLLYKTDTVATFSSQTDHWTLDIVRETDYNLEK